MRPRFAVLVSVLAALATAAAPATAGAHPHAHPHHNRGLTIAATPNPINSGEGVLIYGQLKGTDISGQTISLYHKVLPGHGYTLVGTASTNSFGFYEFTRAEGVVLTNRSWFVRGPDHTHSRTIREYVHALVSLTAGASTVDTTEPVTFTGAVSPNHPFERVVLREQVGENGNTWKTIETARTNALSQFTFTHRWARPGQHTLEAVFPGDWFNIRGESDTVTVTVQQKQVADFTISTSNPIVPVGQSVNITGTLEMPGTTKPEPNTSVTLYGRGADQNHLVAITTTTTGTDGGYSFTQSPVHNEVYRVRTTLAPHRWTAPLSQGVQDAVMLTASPTSVATGAPVTFSGNVTPDKAGHAIYLERQDPSGHWDIVGVHLIRFDSTYSFTRVFGNPGTKVFRTRIFGGPDNVGGASAPVSVTVTTAVIPVATLPPSS